jgi:cob(I)alamin adenosyltransferase
MENLNNDIQDILISQNVELEAKIGRKLQDIRQSVLTVMQNVQEHLFSEEAEFLTEDEAKEILVESIKTKQELLDKLSEIAKNI